MAFDGLRRILVQGQPTTVELDPSPDGVEEVLAEMRSSRAIIETADGRYDLFTGEEYADPTFSMERWSRFAEKWGFETAMEGPDNLALKVDGNGLFERISRLDEEGQARVGSFLTGALYRNFEVDEAPAEDDSGKVNLYVFPKFGNLDIDFDTSLSLLDLLLIMNPHLDAERLYGVSTITDETSSVLVGRVNERIFKVYTDKEVAWKEAAVLEMMRHGDMLQCNVVKLAYGGFPVAKNLMTIKENGDLEPYRFEGRIARFDLDAMIDGEMDIAPEEKEWIKASRRNGFVYFRGMYILTTESEEPATGSDMPGGPEVLTTKRKSLWGKAETDEVGDAYHRAQRCSLLKRLAASVSLDAGELSRDAVSDRILTLALLHRRKGPLMKKLTHYLNESLKSEESLERGVLEDSEDAADDISRMQLRMDAQRFAHNASVYREQLDMVRRLIPEAYHDFILVDLEDAGRLVPGSVLETYIEASLRQRALFEKRRDEGSLVFTHGDAKWDNWFGDVLGDFGSCKFSTEYKDVAKSLLDSAHIFEQDVIDDYLRLYIKARGLCNVSVPLEVGEPSPKDALFRNAELVDRRLGRVRVPSWNWWECYMFNKFTVMMRREGIRGVKERINSFRRNVYDAILTESVRTIHYKSPMPEKRELVDRLVKIAGHYAKVIREGNNG